jgi:hypothetical protein
MRFDGKVVMVAHGAASVGRAIAQAFAVSAICQGSARLSSLALPLPIPNREKTAPQSTQVSGASDMQLVQPKEIANMLSPRRLRQSRLAFH